MCGGKDSINFEWETFRLYQDPFERGDKSMMYDYMVCTPCLLDVWSHGYCCKLAAIVQGISTTSETCQLQSR